MEGVTPAADTRLLRGKGMLSRWGVYIKLFPSLMSLSIPTAVHEGDHTCQTQLTKSLIVMPEEENRPHVPCIRGH